MVKTKITDSKTKETKRTRVKESVKENWKVKVDKAKAIKRPKTEIGTEIKRRQAKFEKFQALKNSILKFSFYPHFAATFIISTLFFNSISSVHSIAISCILFKHLHLETSRVARSIFLYKLKPRIRQRKQKLTPQSLNQQDYPEILKPN